MERLYIESKRGDPSSVYYERILVRPSLHMPRVCLYLFAVLLISALVAVAIYLSFNSILYATLGALAVCLIILILFARRVLVWLVKVYQRFAPEKTRKKCRYEPSCSQYMIIAIEKYGAVRGLIKGVRRLLRCKPPHGGFDMP